MATSEEIRQLHVKIVKYIERHPELTYTEIGQQLGISQQNISRIARKNGLHRHNSKRYTLTPELAKILEK